MTNCQVLELNLSEIQFKDLKDLSDEIASTIQGGNSENEDLLENTEDLLEDTLSAIGDYFDNLTEDFDTANEELINNLDEIF